jgi:hypothetical protein
MPAAEQAEAYLPAHRREDGTRLSAMTVEFIVLSGYPFWREQYGRDRYVRLRIRDVPVEEAGQRRDPGPDIDGQRRSGLRLKVDRLVYGATLVASQDVLQPLQRGV